MTQIDRRSLLAVAGAAVLVPAAPVPARQPGWTPRAAMPWPAQEIYCAVHDGRIVTAGGLVSQGRGQPLHIEDRVARYDPEADRWDTLAPIPRSEAADNQVGGGLAMAALGGKLVAFGGEWFRQGGGGGVFTETWIYDPMPDRWERGPDMATPRHGLAAASFGDAVYAIAGGSVVSGGNATAIVESLTA